MRSSLSNPSLKDLPESIESLSLDRTASSTPAAKHRNDVSQGRLVVLTPPTDTLAEPVTQSQLSKRAVNYDTKDDIYIAAKVEDDVFSGEALMSGRNTRQSLIAKPENLDAVAENTQAPRSDRLREPITPANAQGVLPPAALVFVANLLNPPDDCRAALQRTDQSKVEAERKSREHLRNLEAACHDTFAQFGTCIVNARYDRHENSFALVQYHNIADADRAVRAGQEQELTVQNRRVRVEHANCRRSIVLCRVGGGPITVEETKELLSKYGPIAQMQPTTNADRRLHGLPEGMWAQFEYFLDFKECLQAFNQTTSLFKIFQPQNHEPAGFESRQRPATARTSPGTQRNPTNRSTVDQRSIFLGNLPVGTKERELEDIFCAFGVIRGCNVISKPITGGEGHNTFAFVEYSAQHEAENAVNQCAVNGVDVGPRRVRIRVEPKEYSARAHRRLQPYSHSPSTERYPRGMSWGPAAAVYPPPGMPMPYGYPPFYMHGPPVGYPTYYPHYALGATPPSSTHRQRAAVESGYYYDGSPQGLGPIAASAYDMSQYQDAGQSQQDQQIHRYD